MNISWQYLDKRNAAINALKDYSSMKAIIATTKGEIADVQSRMSGIGGMRITDMPKAPHNPSAGEERMINGIEEIDLLRERYRQAVEFLDWFQPAWDNLSSEEQTVLEMFFLTNDTSQLDRVNAISERFLIERSSVYKKKDRALTHLAVLLYGK